MRIWFLARNLQSFSPASAQHRPIGGSEIALYNVAQGLARLGHEVVVVNRCGPEAGRYDGTRYYDITASPWQSEAGATPPDVLVVCRRMLDVGVSLPRRATVFWAHDYQGVPMETPHPAPWRPLAIAWRRLTGPWFHTRVDRIVVISQFLGDVCRWLYRAPAEKLVIIPQGIETALFRGPDRRRGPLRFIHTSTPDRGLSGLLTDIFPPLRQAFPDAELHLYSYMPLDAYRRFGSPGVVFHGWVPRSELVAALRESTMMLYPSNGEEMGCMAVLESMAAGAPAVTSALGVLPELAGDGTRGVAVRGWPGTPEFSRSFVQATTDLLAHPDRLERMRAAAHEYVMTRHGWDAIAVQWQQVLSATLQSSGKRQSR
jgi:glycosyltransferase involved in cell wall biosynthesis